MLFLTRANVLVTVKYTCFLFCQSKWLKGKTERLIKGSSPSSDSFIVHLLSACAYRDVDDWKKKKLCFTEISDFFNHFTLNKLIKVAKIQGVTGNERQREWRKLRKYDWGERAIKRTGVNKTDDYDWYWI